MFDIVKKLKEMGADDVIAKLRTEETSQIKFANSKIEISKLWFIKELTVFGAKGKRVFLASTQQLQERDLKNFVKKFWFQLKHAPVKEDYFGIAAGRFKYKKAVYDKKIDSVDWIGLTKQAIEAARYRSAGVLYTTKWHVTLVNSNGIEATDKGTELNFSIRTFGIDSGHSTSTARQVKDFDPIKTGEEAREIANKTREIKPSKEGRFMVLLSPMVAANLFYYMSYAFSAFEVDSKNSFLEGKLGKQVASPLVNLHDNGMIKGFDDEGRPTRRTKLISNGILKNYLHNTSTAKKFKVKPTANAGLIYPQAWQLEVSPGNKKIEELIEGIKHGVYITNNWYTRFTNYKTGEFSTIPRDVIFEIKNGKITNRLTKLRLKGSMPELLKNIAAISKERKLIKWWEVDTPVLTGWIVLNNVMLTKPR